MADVNRGSWRQSLLSTKLFIPPARPNLIARPRLTARLDELLRVAGGLTLVSTPPGFGKSTLLATWIAERRPRVAWVSLDEDDNDPTRFFSYVFAALDSLHAGLAETMLPSLQSPQPPIEFILTILLNELNAVSSPFLLVLDDYHVITTPLVHHALAFFIEHQPPLLHLVLATREDPPLALSQLRARGQLLELRASDLRFTPDEAAAFLNQVMGLNLSAENVAALEARTEGWIAGLQLAALSMRGRQDVVGFIAAFTGSHRFILDYLAEQVLQRQLESVQTFLLQTSILERMNAAVCDAVTERHDSQSILEQLDHSNLFLVPLDDERKWYRYHHLFAEVLRHRLQHAAVERIAPFHQRASQWFERNGLMAEAIQHALAGKDSERAAYLIEHDAENLLKRGEHATLKTWLDGLPDELARIRPRLGLYRAWTFVFTQQLVQAEQCLEDVEQMLLRERNNLEEVANANLLAEVAALRTAIALWRDDVPRGIALAQQALEYLPEQNLRLRGDVMMRLGMAYLWKGDLVQADETFASASRASLAAGDVHTAVIALCDQATVWSLQGRRMRALALYERAARIAAEHDLDRTPTTGQLHADLATMLYESNELERSRFHAEETIERGERGVNPRILTLGYTALARVLQAQANPLRALETIEKAQQFVHDFNLPRVYRNIVAAQQVRLWLAQGNVTAAGAWVQSSELSVDDELNFLVEDEHLALARTLIAQGESNQSLKLLARLREATASMGQTDKLLKTLVLQAIALHAAGESERALATLERALALAEPEGYVRTFVDEGETMRLLISDYGNQLRRLHDESSRRLLTYTDKLLAAFPESILPIHHKSEIQKPKSEMVDPLTDRELEILRLIAAGRTNPQIASALVIAVGTVKKYTNNIFTKLGVTNRTQAVARARALSLLSD